MRTVQGIHLAMALNGNSRALHHPLPHDVNTFRGSRCDTYVPYPLREQPAASFKTHIQQLTRGKEFELAA
jgi:hypothetical protein